MTILTGIGEQLVTVGARSVKFRPSLLAMTRIGTPREIVQTFVAVCGAPALSGNDVIDAPRLKAWRRDQFESACCVLWACADDDDISDLVGHVNERFRYVRGILPLEDIVGLASGLLRHGVMGDVKPEATRGAKKSDYLKEFDAREYAATAMAHLGLNEADAWQLTMTGYIGALRAKFPPPKDAKPEVTGEDFDRVKSWLTKVNAKRAANNG